MINATAVDEEVTGQNTNFTGFIDDTLHEYEFSHKIRDTTLTISFDYKK